MARLPRLSLAGLAHHIIQRGNNRQLVFVDDQDRERMLALLYEHSRSLGIAVHAYVLMDNHFHLLATPAAIDGISKWMQAVGRAYVRYFNDRHGRSGTLWEGRYRSTLVQADRRLLDCMIYMDLNPVRAGMVASPQAYRWSSHAHYTGQSADRLISPPAMYWDLGNTPFAREAAYAELVQIGVSLEKAVRFTDATLHGWPLGDAEFLERLQMLASRRVTRGKAGRPLKTR